MRWAIDVGNTQTVVGGWDGAWSHVWRFSTDAGRTGDEWAVALEGRARLDGARFSAQDSVVACSVVPGFEATLARVCELLGMRPPSFLRSGADVGLAVAYDPPHGVGADRIANALEAVGRGWLPCVVVDVGTATTFDAVGADGAYLGGAIMPGPEIAMASLASRTAKLGAAPLEAPATAVGGSTVAALQSGVVLGHAGAVDRLVRLFRAELGPTARAVITGGLAAKIAAHCEEAMELEPNWTLDGLMRAGTLLTDRSSRA
jgi:type III pantothenate kinase